MTNAGLVRLSKVLTGFASASFAASLLDGVVELGDYADQLRALGLTLPKKLAAILLLVGAVGHVAAKISKTWSQKIAAADPKAPAP